MDERAPRSAGPDEPPTTEERLVAAREALAARDWLLAERDRRLSALEEVADRLAAATARIEELAGEVETLKRARRAELAEREARIVGLEAALAVARDTPPARPAGDDLKRIKGIGPGSEALLHGLGITTFRRLAALSTGDRRRLGELLGRFAGRVERDHWVEQARALAQDPAAAPGG